MVESAQPRVVERRRGRERVLANIKVMLHRMYIKRKIAWSLAVLVALSSSFVMYDGAGDPLTCSAKNIDLGNMYY